MMEPELGWVGVRVQVRVELTARTVHVHALAHVAAVSPKMAIQRQVALVEAVQIPQRRRDALVRLHFQVGTRAVYSFDVRQPCRVSKEYAMRERDGGRCERRDLERIHQMALFDWLSGWTIHLKPVSERSYCEMRS